MSKLPYLTLAATALTMTSLAVPEPALAQRVNEIIVYGTDPCPRSTDDEVVVCARKPEAERFRIPERLREGGSLPGLVEADDLGTYVVKFRGAGQGVKALVAEVITGGVEEMGPDPARAATAARRATTSATLRLMTGRSRTEDR